MGARHAPRVVGLGLLVRRARVHLEHADRAARRARSQRVDHHHQVGVVPLAEQVERVAERTYVPGQRALLGDQGCDERTGTVVTPVPAPESGHDDPGAASSRAHVRTTDTSRKWAAHEMQGSWLRTPPPTAGRDR